MRFLVGGYTADKGGEADGIGLLRAGLADDPLAGGHLSFGDAVRIGGSPSWLAWHPTLPVLYAAMEGSGAVGAFARVDERRFVPLGAPVAAGGAVCHVAPSPDGGWLIASCYDDGRVVRIGLDARGGLTSARAGDRAVDGYTDNGIAVGDEEVPRTDSSAPARPAAPPAEATALERLVALLSAPDAEPDEPAASSSTRQSHAHQARFTPAGLVTTDLGFDQVRVWDARTDRLRERQRIDLPRGTGPRHTLWHPSGHLFVVTEHSNEVFVLRPGPDGTWALVAGTPLLGAQSGVDAAAEIAASRDGRFVWVGLRGSNTIATVGVGGDGTDLRAIAQTESGVEWPRHHVIARDTLLIAGQLSHEIVSLAVDERTGVPGRVRHRVSAPSATHLLADRS